MPAFSSLDADVVDGLVDYIMGMSPRFEGPPPVPISVPEPPPLAPDAAARGAGVYEELGCAACHGPRGRGNGSAAGALRDTAGLPLWPADLAHPSWFKAGSDPQDLYRTLFIGFAGTPMPGYADVFVDLDAEAPWNLIAYLATLSRE